MASCSVIVTGACALFWLSTCALCWSVWPKAVGEMLSRIKTAEMTGFMVVFLAPPVPAKGIHFTRELVARTLSQTPLGRASISYGLRQHKNVLASFVVYRS